MREEFLKCYEDYSTAMHNAKCDATYGEGLKILAPKKVLQRLIIALSEVKAGNTSEKQLNETRQMVYFFVTSKRNY